MAKVFRSPLLLPVSFLLAWIFDALFWSKLWGLSFPLFILLLVASGLWLAARAGLRPARKSLWLLIPITLLALISALRAEPITLFTTRFFALALLAIFAVTFLGGRWLNYGASDFVVRLVSLVPVGVLSLRETRPATKKSNKGFSIRSLLPVLRGLLFALPLLLVLGALLSSADPFFAQWLGSLTGFFNIDNLSEYIFRVCYILILGYLITAILMYAYTKSKNENLRAEDNPLVPAFLGFGEAATMLASVNILFFAFVIFQFRYFFGGLANIMNNPAGLTFAEYARRGFAELVFVAFASLLFFMALSAVGKRIKVQQKWFSGLGIGLFLLVSVILVSAFQRLLLYEEAFGFTRMRTFPHVFMIWLGLLLLAVVILEITQRQRAFALAILVAGLGFTATLALLNVDAFIVRANVQRTETGQELDFAYLASLSEDATPALVSSYHQSTNSSLSQRIAGALVCHAAIHNDYSLEIPWQSWTLSRSVAAQEWATLKNDPAFPDLNLQMDPDSRTHTVAINGQVLPCASLDVWD